MNNSASSNSSAEISHAASNVGHPKERTVAVIGNPNTGKSTLFTALTGVHSRIGNYPGVTVEKKIGWMTYEGQRIRLIDLPGTYSLSPRTIDEMVSVDVLLGRQAEIGPVDAVVCIVDASNLERNLYLVSQVLDVGLPTVLVLNMWDVAQHREIKIDAEELGRRLGLKVVPCEAHRRKHLDDVRSAIALTSDASTTLPPDLFPPVFRLEAEQLEVDFQRFANVKLPNYLIERLLLDVGGQLEIQLSKQYPVDLPPRLQQARERLNTAGCRIPSVEAKTRYAWIRTLLSGIVTVPKVRSATWTDFLDRWLTHKVFGLFVFCLVMFGVFQLISTVAEWPMQAIEGGQKLVGDWVGDIFPFGPARSLIVDGVIAGVGGILVFLPQICLLFLFIALLEDCGYMARAAFLMDKLMTRVGLSGKSFVPLMSSFACAIPGIMATRTIENRRDRMVTILIAPLMSCSARAPVYWLMVAAFFPNVTWLGGLVSLKGLILFVMTFFGAIIAVPIAWLFKKTLFKGETPPFVMELPTYKWPSPRIVLHRVFDRASAFVVRAGTLILATSILIWLASYFPGNHAEEFQVLTTIRKAEIERSVQRDEEAASADRLHELNLERNRVSEKLLSESYLGQFGRFIEPAVQPLGWDWRIGVGVIASFPAREVIISTLGTIYSLGGDVGIDDDEQVSRLTVAMKEAKWPDGRKVYSIPVALSIMVFFALCAQCASTLVVIRRETNHWGWAAFTFGYMTVLAYIGAWITFTISSAMNW